MLPLTEQDLDAPVGCDLEVATLEIPAASRARLAAVIAVIGADPQVRDAPELAVQPILAGAADLGVLVEAVGIVAADLPGLVAETVEARRAGVRVLDELLEGQPREPAQVAESLRAIEGIAWRAIAEDHVTGALEGPAELPPRRPVADLLQLRRVRPSLHRVSSTGRSLRVGLRRSTGQGIRSVPRTPRGVRSRGRVMLSVEARRIPEQGPQLRGAGPGRASRAVPAIRAPLVGVPGVA